jgi:hypothetical protein
LVLFRELHREQLSIEHSMQDLDSAVGRLDNILISIYFVIAVLVIAIALVSYSFLIFSVWRCSFFLPGSSVSYTRDWCWHLYLRFVSTVCGIIDIKPLAIF